MGMMLHRHKELGEVVTNPPVPVTEETEPKPEVKRTRKTKQVEQKTEETD